MKRLTIARTFLIHKSIALLFLIMCTYMMTHAQPTYISNTILSGGETNVSKPADINQDGETDILVSSNKIYWLENDGNENFTAHLVDNIGGSAHVDFADINQDGAMDIVAGTFQLGTNNGVFWYENDGNENFTKRTIDGFQPSVEIQAVDLDDNGTMDLVVGDINIFGSTNIHWYDNDGSGSFTKKTINNSLNLNITIDVADMDNDGDKDIVSMTSGSGTKVVWLENNGSESFTRHQLNNPTSENLRGVNLEDLNGDGLLDILVIGVAKVLFWYENEGAGSFTSDVISLDYSTSPESVYPLDWDGDGDKDLITTVNGGDKVISIWENDGNENFTRNDIVSNFPGKDARPIDIDGDGDYDIIGGRNGGVDLITACTDNSNGPAASVLCANPTVELDEDGQYTFTGAELIQGSTDPCTVFNFVSASPAFVDCEDASQTITVTVTAQDDDGNSSTCMANVSVEDNILPEITCQDITITLGLGGSGANISGNDIFVSATDNCPVINYSTSNVIPKKVSCADIGQISATLTVIPAPTNGGQEVSCTVTVTVIDVEPPAVVCNDITIELDENDGTASITPEEVDGIYNPIFDVFLFSNDNCGFASFTLDQTDFDCSHIGDNTVELTGVDKSGNSRSCNATVTVIDAVAPTGVICNDPTVSLDVNGQYIFTGSDVFQSATDACTVSFLSASPASVSCTDIGSSIQVTVTVQDEGGNTATCTSNVTVEDNTAPTVQCATPTVALDANGQYTFTDTELIQSSNDACSAVSFISNNPASVSCADIGNSVLVTVTVQDEGGNTATCMSSVTVEDNTAPTVQCTTPTVALDANGQYTFTDTELIQSSNDACSVVSFLSASPASVSCADVGNSVLVTVTVQDEEGNTATCTSSVTVEDNTAPSQVICNNPTVFLNASGQYTFTGSEVFQSGTDVCSAVSFFSASPASVSCADVGISVLVTVTVQDEEGNTATCTSSVTVEDNTAPSQVICNNPAVFLNASGQYTFTGSEVFQSGTDVCSAVSFFSASPASVDCSNVGSTVQVTVTAQDAAGNTATCMSSVTVEEGTSLPTGWQSTDIGQLGAGNDYAYTPCSQTPEYTVTGGGNNATAVLSDNIAFASYSICGDGSITAKIESVDPNGYGGLMIRESLDTGAKQVSVFSNMSNSLRHEARYTTNGMKQVNSFFKPSPVWLKLERQGDWIFAYYSTTGTNFQYVHAVYVPMQSCVEVGLASFTYLPGSQTEAVFSNVSVSGSNGGHSEGGLQPTTSHTSTYNQQPKTFNLYPNPNNGQFTLQLDEPTPKAGTLTIYNNYGQQVHQQLVEAGFVKLQLDLGRMPSGMYLLEFRAENAQRVVKKFTISK